MNTSPTDTFEWDQLWRFDSESALRPGDPVIKVWRHFGFTYQPLNKITHGCSTLPVATVPLPGTSIRRLPRMVRANISVLIRPKPAAGALSHLRPKFFVNQKIEDSSFKNEKFDLIVSQFGFEYCDHASVELG